ncbi:cytochrome c [Roseibium sp. SCPC15]|uniref:c-type cytochrome n=1 Tax=Roseibium sp. SCP15 TaxID=3141376 RepID=UPI00333587D1
MAFEVTYLILVKFGSDGTMKKALILWSFLVSLLIFVAMLTGYLANKTAEETGTAATTAGFLQPENSVLVCQGADIYASYCASCHGADLEGEPNWQSPNPDGSLRAPPHDETGHTWHHADELLFKITKLGTAQALDIEGLNSAMPGFSDTLSDDEIVAVLSWIKSTWPEDIRAMHDTLNERARQSQTPD